MALRIYKHKETGDIKRSLKSLPEDTWDEVLVAPDQKFMVSSDPFERKSKIKDSDKTLKARARNHSRDVLGDETIVTNLNNGLKESVARNLLNPQGQRRRKIDDI